MNPLGILLGRASPPDGRGLLDFPARWEEEFAVAAAAGLDAIEWLLDADPAGVNPLWSTTGVAQVRSVAARHGIAVPSVCAAYFMAHSLRGAEGRRALPLVIAQAQALGARCVLLPFFEGNPVTGAEELVTCLRALAPALDEARARGLRLGLETPLPAPDLAKALTEIGHPALGVYYDIGNAASLGYDVRSEIPLLGSRIVGVHVKDRTRAGTGVPLGQGAADLLGAFRALRIVGYPGPLILETPPEQDPSAALSSYRDRVRRSWAEEEDHEPERGLTRRGNPHKL